MANHCWNWIEIVASKENIKKLRTILDKIDETEEGLWAGNYPLLIEEPEITEEEFKKMDSFDVYDTWGSKWFTPYIDGYHLAEDSIEGKDKSSYIVISGDSAWSPMIPLCAKLSKHYNASIVIEYEECGNDFGGRYTFSDGYITEIKEATYLEWQYMNGNFEQIKDHFEDTVCNYDTFFSLYCGYKELFKMMEPEDRKIIYETFKKEKDAEI